MVPSPICAPSSALPAFSGPARAFLHARSVEATASLLARLGEQRAQSRRIGALHEAARPLRSAAVDGAELDAPVERVAQVVGAQADDDLS